MTIIERPAPTVSAFYNENDPYCAAWLRNLIAAGLIAPGDVDERSIVDVQPSDLEGYAQCHFFAGIAGWSRALRLAGWPDDRPVWTGSVPCQPLSGAGQRKGHADERHLWPAFCRLIAECRPATIFGEQIASKDGREWLAGVRADLEDLGYAVGAADLPAAGVGAPHIRQRLWWVADADGRFARDRGDNEPQCEAAERAGGDAGGLADSRNAKRRAFGRSEQDVGNRQDARRAEAHSQFGACESVCSFWSRSVLIPCLDGKARRVEPGLPVLVDGLPFVLADGRTIEGASRAALLRGFGNSIVPQCAAEFIRAVIGERDRPT